MVFVTGDAGAGKSTLVDQFLIDAAVKAPETRIIDGDCSEQYGGGEPYQPFVEAFRDLLRDEERGGGKRRFRDLAKELAPHWLAAVPVAGDLIAATAATAVELKGVMGGATGTATAAPSEEALFFQYTELLLAAAATTPLILYIDDLHWADRASVSLLGHVGRKIADQPVLIIGTYRPADVDVSKHPIREAKLELERYGVAEEVALSALDSRALGEIIAGHLDGPATPELRIWLERRAGSNPLFFSELLKWLVDNGYVRERHGEWGLARRPDEVQIPRSAESAIEKRLSRLDPDVYRILEYASVEGNEFHSTVLARLLDMDELELEETLDPLTRLHRLIRLEGTQDLPNGDLASVYEFSHSLFQDVLHNGLQGKRRILLHRKTAQILEEIHALDLEPVAHKLALHFDEGRQPERAYEFAVRASQRASRFYAHWDAIELLQRALGNSQNEDQRLDVLERLGDENRFIGRYSEALVDFAQALRGEVNGEVSARTVRIRRKVLVVERDFGNRSPEELRRRLEALAEDARQLDNRVELCEVLWGFSKLPGVGPGKPREALSIAEELGDPTLVAKAHYRLGTALLFDEPGEATPHFREALDFYTEREDVDNIGLCYNCLAIAHLLHGRYPEAVEEFQRAAEAFDRAGDPVNEASVRNNLGVLLTRTGDWDGAEENFAETVRLLRRMDATARLLHPLENMARLARDRGDREGARTRWEELLKLAQETGYWESEIVAHCALGLDLLETGDTAGAREQLESAQELAGRSDEWADSRLWCQTLDARLAMAQGDHRRALRTLGEAEAELVSRDRYQWARMLLLHAELLMQEDPQGAAAMLSEALETFESMGAEPMRQQALELLSRTRHES